KTFRRQFLIGPAGRVRARRTRLLRRSRVARRTRRLRPEAARASRMHIVIVFAPNRICIANAEENTTGTRVLEQPSQYSAVDDCRPGDRLLRHLDSKRPS